ncbi:MAG TPA: carbohydrate ABC transporter permease, partial [Clostridia bacterium]|nr:carbohydrate ABC transporter permease [Clostridia bacterium]
MQKPMRIRQSPGSRAFDIFNVAFLLLLMAVTLYPLWYVAVVSVSDGKAVLAGKVNLWPAAPTLASFHVVLKDSSVLHSFRNSVLYTVLGTCVNLSMTTLCAYPLTHADLAGRKVLMRLIVFTMFFSGGMIPTYLVVRQLGLIDSIGAMVLPGAISTYNLIVMRS